MVTGRKEIVGIWYGIKEQYKKRKAARVNGPVERDHQIKGGNRRVLQHAYTDQNEERSKTVESQRTFPILRTAKLGVGSRWGRKGGGRTRTRTGGIGVRAVRTVVIRTAVARTVVA